MAQTQSNPYVINTSNTFFNTARFVMSDGSHVPNWPEIMPKLRRFWEEYAKHPINFEEDIGNDGDRLGRLINEEVLQEFNEWQRIKHLLEARNKVLNKNLNKVCVDFVNRRYMADMQRALDQREWRLEADYHSIYRKLRRASTETWPPKREYMLKPGEEDKIRYKVRLSDEIRALADEICKDMTRGDPSTSWR